MPHISVLTVIFARRIRRQGARAGDAIEELVDIVFDSSGRAIRGVILLKPHTIALPLWWFPRDSLVSDGVKDEQLEELKEDSQDYAALHIMQLSKALNDSSSEVAAVAEAQFLKDCSKYLLGKPVWKQVWSPLIPSANAGAGKTAHLVTGDRAPRLLEWVRGGIGDAIVALVSRRKAAGREGEQRLGRRHGRWSEGLLQRVTVAFASRPRRWASRSLEVIKPSALRRVRLSSYATQKKGSILPFSLCTSCAAGNSKGRGQGEVARSERIEGFSCEAVALSLISVAATCFARCCFYLALKVG